MNQRYILLFIFTLIIQMVVAQQPAKKSLQISDFPSWNTIPNKEISNNGKYFSYEQNPQKGDGTLYLLNSNRRYDFNRGCKARFGSENDVLVYHIKPQADSIRQAKLDKVKKENMPKDSLGIFLFKREETFKYPKVKSFKLPKENARWIAFLLEPEIEKNDSSQTKTKQPGEHLVLFNIQLKDTISLSNVTEYSWSKNGSYLACIQQTKDSVNTYSKLLKFDSESGSFSEKYSITGWLKKASLDDNGKQCAFIASKDTVDEKTYELYLNNGAESRLIVNSLTRNMPIGWSVSEYGKINFSEDADKLYFGTAKIPEAIPEDTLLDEEKPKLDVWNWKDKKLQPQQLLEVKKEKERSYRAVYRIEDGEFMQLGDLTIRDVKTIEKGNNRTILGINDQPYLRESSWTGKRIRDYYLIDIETGIKREIIKAKSFVRLSPMGKFVLWYEPEDSSYYCVSTDINNLEVIALTRQIPVSFYNEWNDRPMDPNPYGVAGWSEDDRFVYIYDRYDIWRIDPTGERVPVCVTKAFGRRNKTRLRYKKLDPELEHIPTNETILLTAIDERTMSQGFFSARLGQVKDPDLLVMDKYMFSDLKKAKEADKVIWTKQNVKSFPNVWCSNLDFKHARKLSDANPQQKEYIWPEVELVEWTSFSGESLKGLLYKPDKFDPTLNYPMIVYFYERSAETMHMHHYPKPSRSTINRTFYTSNNYLVFVPDITYKNGYPGQSAYNAIVSGTQYLLNKYKFINPKRIGLQGQSWGGYQTAWLITQTDLYAAAMAGAPVSNMTSAYGGIRWGSGMSRMFQYEHTQSRIGGTLWDKPLLYLENSPLFHAPKIKTPLLMMHNDKDGAVPWYQGIELFVALRRLNKPVWLLNYNDQPHNLAEKSWANRMDLSTKMFQFFNHYLKGDSAPEWLEKGIPAIDKRKTQEKNN